MSTTKTFVNTIFEQVLSLFASINPTADPSFHVIESSSVFISIFISQMLCHRALRYKLFFVKALSKRLRKLTIIMKRL